MRHSVNVLTFAASGHHCKHAAPCPEGKCIRANAHSGYCFTARNLNTNQNAGAGFPTNCQRANVIFRNAGGEELAMQRQELEARELEVEWRTRAPNLNAVRDAETKSAAPTL